MSRARARLASPVAPFARLTAAASLSIAVVVLVLPGLASADNCPNAAYRNGPSAALPECRAYEMVTPPYKEGFPVQTAGEPFSPEGESVFGFSLGNFAGAEVDRVELAYFNNQTGLPLVQGAEYVFSREASGWKTTAVGLPESQYRYSATFRLNPSLTKTLSAAVSSSAPHLSVTNYPTSFYIRNSNGPIVEVGPVAPPFKQPRHNGYFYFAGASGDLSHVLFALREDLWPDDASYPQNPEAEVGLHTYTAQSLYEYVGTGNFEPMLVGVEGGAGSGKLISRCGTALGAPKFSDGNNAAGRREGAVSSNGAVVYFTALACEQSGAPTVNELYARVDSGQPDAHTVSISEPSKEDCSECDTEAKVLAGGYYKNASADGSKVFFTTTQPLLGQDVTNNLYEYDFEREAGHRIVRVSGGDSTVSDPVANVEHVEGASPDGSLVYFTASGVLTETPNSRGEKAQAGQSNLYLYEQDSQYPGGRTVFILPSTSIPPRSGNEEVESEQQLEEGEPILSVSQNGRFLAFKSYAHLTPDTLGPAEQAFEYDSQTGDFARVSIGQNGYNDNGNSGSIGFGNPRATLLVANNGAAFFDSVNPLVPRAVSGQSEAYEYHEGTVSLISDGQATTESDVVSVTPSGADVFFYSLDRLVSSDVDSQSDLYDARVDGGFPEVSPPTTCEGDSCQGALNGAPVLLSPGSELQAGGENVASLAATPASTPKPKVKLKAKPKKCKKATKLKRNRCANHKAKRASKGSR